MFNTRPQDLAEAVTSIIAQIVAMMLGLLRARGLRALMQLPTHIRLALELRRMGQEFAALFAAFKAGTLPPPPPAPEQARQAAPAQPRVPTRVAARRNRANRRPQPAMPPSAPAESARPDRPRGRMPALAMLPPACRYRLPPPRDRPPKKSGSGARVKLCPIHYDIATK